MNWSTYYAFRSYVRSSNWIVPVIAIALQQLVFRSAMFLDEHTGWVPAWPLSQAGTHAALQTIISLILAFIVFTYGSMLVAIQVASGQLTPRIIATALLRNNVLRVAVGYFIFTLLFAIGTLSRMETAEQDLIIWMSVVSGLVSLVVFLYLIDYSARLLRPVSIVWDIASQGMDVIDDVYPHILGETDERTLLQHDFGVPARVVSHAGTSAIILAVNVKALATEAEKLDGAVKIAVSIGDFVASGHPLFFLYGGAAAIPDVKLEAAVAFGRERTIEQDSTFAFRVIVDVAIKALSTAINDPTTAVLAIDQLHRLLRRVGERNLHNDLILDSHGKVRGIFPMPKWEDFVQLSCREIRLYGAGNFQIARRLRAMLENLEETLPERRGVALQQERELLDQMIEKVYLLDEDAELARIPDTQGLGGPQRRKRVKSALTGTSALG